MIPSNGKTVYSAASAFGTPAPGADDVRQPGSSASNSMSKRSHGCGMMLVERASCKLDEPPVEIHYGFCERQGRRREEGARMATMGLEMVAAISRSPSRLMRPTHRGSHTASFGAGLGQKGLGGTRLCFARVDNAEVGRADRQMPPRLSARTTGITAIERHPRPGHRGGTGKSALLS